MKTGKITNTIEAHNHWIMCMRLFHDSELLATGCFDNSIKIWNWEEGLLEHEIKDHKGYT
eukprot:UN13369